MTIEQCNHVTLDSADRSLGSPLAKASQAAPHDEGLTFSVLGATQADRAAPSAFQAAPRKTIIAENFIRTIKPIRRSHPAIDKSIRHLSDVNSKRKLWRNAEILSEGELVDSTALAGRLCREVGAALEHIWAMLLTGLEQSKVWEKMAATTGLYAIPLAGSGADQGSFHSPAASGTFFFPQKP